MKQEKPRIKKETRAAARVQPSVEATAAIDAKIAQAKALPGEVSERSRLEMHPTSLMNRFSADDIL